MSATDSKARKTPNPLIQSARYQAMLALTQAVRGEQFLNDAVQEVLSHGAVTAADRGLFTELAYGTMQRHYTLDQILSAFIKQPQRVKRWAWELLALSLYQYFYLTQIPAHALVNEAVKIAKQRGGVRLARFTNGVLRNIMRHYETVDDAVDDLAQDARARVTLRYSLPPVWYDYFSERFGTKTTTELAASLVEPYTLTVRVSPHHYADEDALVGTLKREGYAPSPSPIAPHAYRVAHGNPAHSALFKDGAITIQDASALLAVRVLAPRPGETVLDACAAPGGKTVQLAEAVGASGVVEAFDVSAAKVARIEDNCRRMHVDKQVHVHQADVRQAPTLFSTGHFDRLLIDAPCSGVGLFRHKPDTKYHKQLTDLKALQKIQLDIIEPLLVLLRPGGTMVYSTCTITREENDAVVQRVLARHPEFSLVPFRFDADQPLKRAVTDKGTLEILPQQFGSDGFFIAKLQKQK